MRIFGIRIWPSWIDRALKTPEQLEFNYVSYSNPDIVAVWRRGEYLGRFSWIDGVDASKDSQLGKLYALWDTEKETEV